jgi:hypothetical protein
MIYTLWLGWTRSTIQHTVVKWAAGWSCRDHAVVLAALITVEALSAHVVRGASIYIQGPTSSGEEPTGLGNVLEAGGGHTWVDVPTFGTVDVSPRLDVRVAHWRPIPVSGLVGTEWEVSGLASHVAVLDGAGRYEEAITQATQTFDTATAIYWPQEVERFHVGMLDVWDRTSQSAAVGACRVRYRRLVQAGSDLPNPLSA